MTAPATLLLTGGRPTPGDDDARVGTGRLPLVVDLDGTLVRTDTLAEAVIAVALRLRLGPALWLLLTRGRAAFKRRISEQAPPAAALLPYNEPLLAWLRAEKDSGRRLVLATAADSTVAGAVASHLGLFDDVIASDGSMNLKGAAKADALTERFGARGFVYAGDSRADVAVWRAAAGAVVVNAAPAVAAAARAAAPIEREIAEPGRGAAALWHALRPHQWVKNLLVLVPLVTAHAYGDATAWLHVIQAFAAFCVIASACYIVNDLSDLSADRAHRRKRARSFASGRASVSSGVALAAVLTAVGLATGAAAGALAALGVYAVTTLAYSVRLKELPLVDVFCLAGLYTLRLFGGGEAAGHFVSLWLLGFSGFVFLSLALVKRVEELSAGAAGGGRNPARRGYLVSDAPILQMFGCAAAFAASLVLALFVQSEATAQTYASPGLLWGCVPLVLFWQCRLWLATARGYMHEDPIVYATHDWVSWIVGALLLALLVLAKSLTLFPL